MNLNSQVSTLSVSGSTGGATFTPRESRSSGSTADLQSGGDTLPRVSSALNDPDPSPVTVPSDVLAGFVAQLQEFLSASDRDLQVQVSDFGNRIVVRVLSASTGEVIREIPPDRILRVLNNLATQGSSLFLSLEA